jgi:hypothetical protein
MGVGAAVVGADWVALISLWVAPKSHPAEMVAQMLKRAGKWMYRQGRLTRLAGCGGVADVATTGVASTVGLKVFFPRSVPLRM